MDPCRGGHNTYRGVEGVKVIGKRENGRSREAHVCTLLDSLHLRCLTTAGCRQSAHFATTVLHVSPRNKYSKHSKQVWLAKLVHYIMSAKRVKCELYTYLCFVVICSGCSLPIFVSVGVPSSKHDCVIVCCCLTTYRICSLLFLHANY